LKQKGKSGSQKWKGRTRTWKKTPSCLCNSFFSLWFFLLFFCVFCLLCV
jgi:hypothetical protein